MVPVMVVVVVDTMVVVPVVLLVAISLKLLVVDLERGEQTQLRSLGADLGEARLQPGVVERHSGHLDGAVAGLLQCRRKDLNVSFTRLRAPQPRVLSSCRVRQLVQSRFLGSDRSAGTRAQQRDLLSLRTVRGEAVEAGPLRGLNLEPACPRACVRRR